MGKINVLGFDVANLIAAGEVVDRPSSVVKELLENAIDSGATSIIIEIKKGGSAFIRITDNGCGIAYDDLPVAILRHATSKIKDADDLESIMTLGFRGEALAAISSVSKIRIMTKQRSDKFGSLLEAHAGTVVNHIKTGSQDGTTVIVEDLFYNVPARKKFLKQDKTEALAISGIVEKVALSRPDISFRYIIDGELKYLTAGDGSLSNVIYAILGRDVSKKTIKVDREDGGIKVRGFISTPELNRANRNLENFYINSRFVKSKTASAALEQAYKSYIPDGKFPFCVLDIIIDPSQVDVNVHPAKLEVKFSNENVIFNAVYYAVRTALSNSITTPSLYNEEKPKNEVSPLNTLFQVQDKENNEYKASRIVFDSKANVAVVRQNNTLDYSSFEKKDTTKVEIKDTPKSTYADEDAFSLKFPKREARVEEKNSIQFDAQEIKMDVQYNVQLPKTVTPVAENEKKIDVAEPKTTIQSKIVPDYKIIGELYNSYVIVELGEIAYVIDKHAAHERIIFEDLKAKINQTEPSSQILLFPIEINLTKDEEIAICEWEEDIKKTGFGFSLENGVVSVSEIPSEISPSAVEDTFVTLLDKLASGEADAENSRYQKFERALYQCSCKAAIKAGRVYDKEHIKWICDRVLTLDNIKYCPHGRPIAFEITKHFLEKQFERK
ncbi:MAG: DNA mismatch repair endonuclease MutL [Ruminococcaceae bacterium]|nr:DNA mismatch repair endonuclease MutL [Oscillospiraceae bacterium]